MRTTSISLPNLGRWASWHLRERDAVHCNEGGVTWAMSVVLAHILGAQPEYPRLSVLELGAGTGLASLAAAGRGHSVMATDRDGCVLENLQHNVQAASAEGRGDVLPGRLRTARLRWAVAEDREAVGRASDFDLLAGADLIYDRPQCDGIRILLSHLLGARAEAVFVERDRLGHARLCAARLREDGLEVEEVEQALSESDIQAVVNGNLNPRLLRAGSASPLTIWVRRPPGSAEA